MFLDSFNTIGIPKGFSHYRHSPLVLTLSKFIYHNFSYRNIAYRNFSDSQIVGFLIVNCQLADSLIVDCAGHPMCWFSEMRLLMCLRPSKCLPFRGFKPINFNRPYILIQESILGLPHIIGKLDQSTFQWRGSDVGFESFYYLKYDCKILFSFSLWTVESHPP